MAARSAQGVATAVRAAEKETRAQLVDRLAKDVIEKQVKYYNELLLHILLRHGPIVYQAVVACIVKLQSAQFKEQYRLDDDPYSVLGLTKEAPDELVKFAYIFWARRYHPDHHGGDGKPMARVNDAMERIAVERGWKVMALTDGREGV